MLDKIAIQYGYEGMDCITIVAHELIHRFQWTRHNYISEEEAYKYMEVANALSDKGSVNNVNMGEIRKQWFEWLNTH